jgi:hypothetical protein
MRSMLGTCVRDEEIMIQMYHIIVMLLLTVSHAL